MRIQKEMKFINFKEGEALFIDPQGEEVRYRVPDDNECSWGRELTEAVSKMELGKIYDFQVVELVIIDVLGKNLKYEKMKRRDDRKKYLKVKMDRGTLTDQEFSEALRLGVKTPNRNYTWGIIATAGILANYMFDFTVGITLFGGLVIFSMLWGYFE